MAVHKMRRIERFSFWWLPAREGERLDSEISGGVGSGRAV
jgi:hypothetical protein